MLRLHIIISIYLDLDVAAAAAGISRRRLLSARIATVVTAELACSKGSRFYILISRFFFSLTRRDDELKILLTNLTTLRCPNHS